MAIPATPLVIKESFDYNEMTLDEAVVFEPAGFSLNGFRNFLITNSKWTAKEIGAIKVKELKEIAEQLGNVFREIAVPKVN
jgi:hypothetical protein